MYTLLDDVLNIQKFQFFLSFNLNFG